jgi:hypothetical protein
MESSGVTSQEKIERMLAEGKISRADYERLIKAMSPLPKEADLSDSAEAKPRKVYKSWENGQIGGICAGYAAYFGIDARSYGQSSFLLFYSCWPGMDWDCF